MTVRRLIIAIAALLIAWSGWNAISYVLLPPNHGAVEGVDQLKIRLSVKSDDSIMLEEDYRLRTESDGRSPFAGIAHFVRLSDGGNVTFRCTGKLNGQPVEIQSASFRDSAVLLPVVTPIASAGNASFQVSCDITGLVQSDGFEKRLVFPLTDAHLSVSIERLFAQIFFLFPPDGSSIGRPRLSAALHAHGGVEDLSIIREQANLFSLALVRRHPPGSEVLLKATWRPPT